MRTTPSFFLLFLAISLSLLSCKQETDSASLPGFEINPLFQLELVAAEPLVLDPVDMEFDEQGRAFVLEMPGYPLRDEESRLILLKDENGDGFFDKRHLYADSLGVASSILPYNGGMLVAAPPYLLFLKDTDGDDVADEREILMEGFSKGNLQHNFNGLTYGLDNWIYAANGGNNGAPYFVGNAENALPLRGEDFRFDMENNILERVGESSGGFELAFDHYGRMFETHNLEHVSQLVFPGHYLQGLPVTPAHSLTNISDHEENGLSRIYPIGEQETRVNHPEQSGYFSGSCGITFYGGNAFPEGYNDNLFVCDVVLNLIHLDVLSPNKSAFKASRMREGVEFLASTDRAFRPVNMATGPDRSLFVLDMHRDVIEHPEWIPDEIEATQDLGAGKDKGRIYRIRPKVGGDWRPPTINPQDPASLVRLLGDPNQWTRMTAQRLLVEQRSADVVPDLLSLMGQQNNPYARLHALWTLDGLGELPDSILKTGLYDPDPAVQENAIKIAEKYLDSSLIKDLLAILHPPRSNDPPPPTYPRVQMQGMLTLSTMSEKQFEQYEPQLLLDLTNILGSNQADTWMSMAAASAAKREPAGFSQMLLFGKLGPVTPARMQAATYMARYIGKEHLVEEADHLLTFLQDAEVLDPPEKSTLVAALADGWAANSTKSRSTKAIVSALESLEKEGDIPLIQASGHLRKAMGLPVSRSIQMQLAEAEKAVHQADLSPEKRLEYLQLLAMAPFEKREETLFQLLDNRQPLDLQTEALTQLWKANEYGIAERLLEMWPKLGPEARKGAGNILLYQRDNHDLLLTALEGGTINPGELNLDWNGDAYCYSPRMIRSKQERKPYSQMREWCSARRPSNKCALRSAWPGMSAKENKFFRPMCELPSIWGDRERGRACTHRNSPQKQGSAPIRNPGPQCCRRYPLPESSGPDQGWDDLHRYGGEGDRYRSESADDWWGRKNSQ